jgi:hypothetical protein
MQNQLETLKEILELDLEWFEIQIKASSELKDNLLAFSFQIKKDYANSIINEINQIIK